MFVSPVSVRSPTHNCLEGPLTNWQQGTNDGFIITFHTLIEEPVVTFNE